MLRMPASDLNVPTQILTPSLSAPLRVFVDADGARHLLVPGRTHDDLALPHGSALSTEVLELVFDGRKQRFLDIACAQPQLFAVFDDLLASIVEASLASGSPMQAAVEMLGRWRELLRAWNTALTVEREMGLFAELYVLHAATAGMPFDASIWRGPLHEPKDLVFPAAWVEVKAAGVASSTVHINGLAQLDDVVGIEEGFLAVVTLQESSSGRTIEEVVNDLRATSTDPEFLDELLLLAGWGGDNAGKRWQVVSLHLVAASVCPRITVSALGGQVPAGLGAFRYELDLGVVRALSLRDPESNLLRLVRSSP